MAVDAGDAFLSFAARSLVLCFLWRHGELMAGQTGSRRESVGDGEGSSVDEGHFILAQCRTRSVKHGGRDADAL
jgi:hypothetical protein